MSEMGTPLGDDVGDAQATERRVNPWWILGAIFVVLAIVLGIRSVRKKAAKDALEDFGGTPEFGEPGDESEE
jgi:hypothetical protein